ncbi:MAG: glycosyltransferase family 4 protein [Aggregatilineaceae bacterium]
MRVVHLSAEDITGGAARAAQRLHLGLRAIGIDSRMVVRRKGGDDPYTYPAFAVPAADGRTVRAGLRQDLSKLVFKACGYLDQLPLRRYPRRQRLTWSVGWVPTGVPSIVSSLQPDVVHLHWIGAGFVPIRALPAFKRPLVWTLHDMWAFTGGCHQAIGCARYQQSCGSCPQLQSGRTRDLSQWIWSQKRKHWAELNLIVVALSRWMADCARQSALFGNKRIEVIPNGIDTSRYRPHEQALARQLLGLPTERRLILFGAMHSTSDPLKGLNHLQGALRVLSQSVEKERLHLIVFGATEPIDPPDFGFPTTYVGSLHDDVSLSLYYSAADVFVAPSRQDNFPNTVLEALACGVPCVAFEIGGMPDLIAHQQNGYLARPFEEEDLALGISWVLQDELRRRTLAEAARRKVEREYELTLIARRYEALYHELLRR